ncbi:hypothetical protein RND71_040683 [Anisodus tanguticus]|uniref:Uncharacterized protein n=1 Tax=Anisodus tanguticus TaxID=243964 RepID=A0AAE1UTK5_9SOLA|nr:hypothetical protein RND71_040683 [Anisodus tanguticus]
MSNGSGNRASALLDPVGAGVGIRSNNRYPTVILKLPCLVEKKRTKVRSLAVLFSAMNWDRSPARKGFLSPQSRCSLRSTSRSRGDVDHIGWGHSPRAELEAKVRTLGGVVAESKRATFIQQICG